MKVEFLLVVFALFASSAFARKEPMVAGGWTRIGNITDPDVTEIANYAVTEFDKRYCEKLKLEKVINGYTQVVAGVNYRLTLAATNGFSSNNYEAIVFEQAWRHFRNLTSFTPVHA